MFDPFAANKLLRFPERISEWMRTGKTSSPIVVDFDLTNKCPHNCPRCPGEWRSDPTAEIPKEDALKFLAEFRALGTLAVSFGGGGDPLAHPDAVDIFKFAKSIGLSVGVITNAAILKPGMAKRLVDTCDWIRISLDAATPATFARVHGVPETHFDRIVENIRELANVPDRTCTIGVGFLTDADSSSEIVDAARIVKETGADYIQYRPYNHDRYYPGAEITEAKRLHETDRFKVLASWPKYDLMFTPWEKSYETCHAPHFATVMTCKGELHICCDHRGPEGYLGSAYERPISDIWSSAETIRQCLDSIDINECPPFCRGNCHNLLLDSIAQPITHEVFL